MPFRVLVVCTGNVCRSPIAEHLLRAALPADVEVGSAGTGALVGEPMQPYALAVLADRGLDGRAFRARQLRPEHVAEADLVLTATRAHRLAVADLQAGAALRTFTLLEAERLCASVDPAGLPPADRGAGLVAALRSVRGQRPRRPDDDDLVDPYRRGRRHFASCADRVERAVAAPVRLLRG